MIDDCLVWFGLCDYGHLTNAVILTRPRSSLKVFSEKILTPSHDQVSSTRVDIEASTRGSGGKHLYYSAAYAVTELRISSSRWHENFIKIISL